MNDKLLQPEYYMIGKSRYLFWLLLACSIIIQIIKFSSIINFDSLFIPNLVIDCLGITFLLLYGLKNKVKVFRVVFFILFGFSILNTVSITLNDFGFRNLYIQFSGELDNGGWVTSFSSMELVSPVCWIVCMFIIVCNKNTSTVLRVSAILLAAIYLCGLVYTFANDLFYNSTEFFITVLVPISMTLYIIQFLLLIFFYAAISFSKQKPPKAIEDTKAVAIE